MNKLSKEIHNIVDRFMTPNGEAKMLSLLISELTNLYQKQLAEKEAEINKLVDLKEEYKRQIEDYVFVERLNLINVKDYK